MFNFLKNFFPRIHAGQVSCYFYSAGDVMVDITGPNQVGKGGGLSVGRLVLNGFVKNIRIIIEFLIIYL